VTSLHIVFGTGPLGLAVMRALRARDLPVRMVNRSSRVRFPKDLHTQVGGIDAVDPRQTREVCEGAAVVYHCIGLPYVRWETELPAISRGILEGAASAGARLVYGDNLYAYGQAQGPLREDLPEHATTRKGRLRAAIAESFLNAHRAGRVAVAIGRASDFYGPWVTNAVLGERVFAPALAGKAANLVGRIDRLHTYTFIDDFAEALVTLGERDEAVGRAWIVPSAPTLTTRALVEMIYQALGSRVRLRVAPAWLLAIAGCFDANLGEFREMQYQFQSDFVADHSAFERQFGAHITPHERAIEQTIEWYRNGRPPQMPTRFRRQPLD
jgi:nucleoside-diphosphate-sugar epimerase